MKVRIKAELAVFRANAIHGDGASGEQVTAPRGAFDPFRTLEGGGIDGLVLRITGDYGDLDDSAVLAFAPCKGVSTGESGDKIDFHSLEWTMKTFPVNGWITFDSGEVLFCAGQARKAPAR